MSTVSDPQAASRLENLKTACSALIGLCHDLKRATAAADARGDLETAGTLCTCHGEALNAMMALNSYARSCIAERIDMHVFIEFANFATQFKLPSRGETRAQ